jgi:hypothetical protein
MDFIILPISLQTSSGRHIMHFPYFRDALQGTGFVPFKYIHTFEVFAPSVPALNFSFETSIHICMG